MLNFGNKEFRNLQEQVLKNAQDIETLKGREDLQIVIVNELPVVGNPNYIYLVAKNSGESPDVYDEYIWLENEQRYEKIGGVTIDLTNYVTTDTEQTITANKKISSNLYFGDNNARVYSNSGVLTIYGGSDGVCTIDSLIEGKNREIRKIFSFLGYEVKGLTRVRIGCILLGNMQPGEYRNLTKKEIDGLLAGKTTLVERKKFGAALKREKAEKKALREKRNGNSN